MLVDPKIIQQGNNYHVQHGTDASAIVQFYMHPVQDEEASLKEGRPIYNDKEYIKIMFAGDKSTVRCRPVDLVGKNGNFPDNVRWPAQYAAFKNQNLQVMEGTPLEEWPPLTKSQVLMFKASNVHTVEQLAAVTDQNIGNLGMGARVLRDKANSYLSDAKTSAIPMAAQEEINNLKNQIEALKNQMAGLGAETEKKQRGRPKKEVDDGENITTDDTTGSE
jgi:hypothetical protein